MVPSHPVERSQRMAIAANSITALTILSARRTKLPTRATTMAGKSSRYADERDERTDYV
jgi:hypothetical protein